MEVRELISKSPTLVWIDCPYLVISIVAPKYFLSGSCYSCIQSSSNDLVISSLAIYYNRCYIIPNINNIIADSILKIVLG